MQRMNISPNAGEYILHKIHHIHKVTIMVCYETLQQWLMAAIYAEAFFVFAERSLLCLAL